MTPNLRPAILLAIAAAVSAGDVAVTASIPWEDRDGYTPVIVRVETLARRQTVTVTASLGEALAVDAVQADPGSPAVRTLLVPSHGGWGGARVAWDGGELSVGPLVDYRSVDAIVLDPRESLPLPALAKTIGERVPDPGETRGGFRRGTGTERIRRVPADILPDRWQGWPAWLTVITTPAGEAQLSPAQREAVAAWTRVGGAVFVTSADSLDGWRRHGIQAELVDPADPVRLVERLRATAGEDGRPAANPVPGTEELPTAWFLTLAIAFAIIAGPVNLWWVRRRGRPHLLLITTPLISVGACVLLVTVALASDGIGRRRIARQVVILDAGSQRCAGFTAATYFCGIAPGRFAVDPEDRLMPMDESDFRGGWSKDRPRIGLDGRGGSWADEGWIPARINRQLAWTQVRPERRRLAVRREGAAWRIGNGLGVAITELAWIDPDGAAWATGRIEPGADAIARPGAAGASTDLAGAQEALGVDARLALASLSSRHGVFTARLAAPLLPLPGPEASDVEPPRAWVTGLLAPDREVR